MTDTKDEANIHVPDGLPYWGMLIVGTRCVRRLQPLHTFAVASSSRARDGFWADRIDAILACVEASSTTAELDESRLRRTLGFAEHEVDSYEGPLALLRAAADVLVDAMRSDFAGSSDSHPRFWPGAALPATAALIRMLESSEGTGEALNQLHHAAESAFSSLARDIERHPSDDPWPMSKTTRDILNRIAHRGPSLARQAFVRDLELLIAVSDTQRWTDDTPVPPEFFGPMWPEGEPEGWPSSGKKAKTKRKLFLQIAVPVDTPDDELDETVAKLARAASELHVAHGGSGLVVNDQRVYETADIPAGVDA